MSKSCAKCCFLALSLLMVALPVLLLTAAQPASAQSLISGNITGTVTDSTGAAIVGASITVTNTSTGAAKTVTTGSAGDYTISLLQPGPYNIRVSAPNFQTAQTSAAVAVGQTATVNMTLSLAKGTTTVQVMGSTVPLLQTQNSDISTTITMDQVQNLPNPGGDITYYVQLTQGVVMNTQGGYGNSSAFGLPATSNNFTVNGAEDNDPFLNLNNSGPSNLLLGSNDVDEVNIVANAYSAQYGALGGVQENIITRSGSNKFHGNATYWWTNSDLNANDWFNDNSDTPQAFSNANQWGAAVGGPIKKDKAFFFVNYEGLRFVTAPSDPVFLPSALYETNPAGSASTTLNGDGGTETIVNNPSVLGADGACDDNTSFLYANGDGSECGFYKHVFSLYNGTPNAASATGISSVPAGTTNCLANDASGGCTFETALPSGLTYANYLVANPKNNLTETLVTARLDLKLGASDSGFIHFKRDHGLQPTYVDPVNSAFNGQSDQPDYEGQLEETHTFSPNLVNQFILSGSWYSAYFLSANQANATATFPYTMELIDGSFSNLGGIDLAWPEGRNVTQYQINEDVSWIHGKHSANFGLLFKRDDVTDADLGVLTTPLGAEYGPAAAGPFSGYDLFGAGLMLEGIENFPARLSEPISVYNLGFYAQDQWKFTPSFQITAGVRVEHNSNPVCGTNCFARFTDTYSNVTATLDTPYNKALASGLSTAFTNLQGFTVDPRVGFTWSPFGHDSTVLRGGFGIFTDIFPATIADDLITNPPLNPEFYVLFDQADPSQSGSFQNALASTNAAFQSGFPSGGSFNSISATNPNFSVPNLFSVDKNIHYPTYEEWSLQVQQALGHHTSFQVGYVGNHGYHEPVQNNGVNMFGFGGAPSDPTLPAFGEITEIQSNAVSNYNGLIATVKHQSKYSTALFNYAWSHALDEISNGGILPFGGNSYYPVDPFNLRLQNYGNGDYDLRQNMNASYILTVPYFRGPRFLTDRWQIGGTIFWHSGFPFSVTDGDVSGALGGQNYGGSVLADVVTNPSSHQCGKSATTTPCLDVADFADPTGFGDPGYQRRNQFTGPGYFNSDFNLLKGFKIPSSETASFQVGVQAYNVFNHPNFANPIYDISSPVFGQVFSTVSVPTSVFGSFLGGDASPRILQLKAKFQF